MTTSTATTSPARKQVAGNSKQWADLHGHWLLGCMRQVQLDSMNLYQSAWREHGDYVRLRALPGFYFFLLAHPAAIEYVLQGNYKNYRKPDSFNHSASLLAGNGILTSEGEFWRKQRRLMQPAFLRGSVAKLSEHMASGLADFVREWEAEPDGRTLDAVPEMMRLALRIGSVTLVGTDISGNADAIGHAYRTAFEYVSLKMNARLLFSPLWMPTQRNREFRKAKALLDRVVLDLVAARRTQPARHDVLGLLLAAQDEETGVGMSDQQLKDEVLTLLTAGHETAGAALSWSIYLLATHPEIQQQLHEECADHLGGRLPTADDLPKLPWATAVFEESMRLYPPAWGMPRETIAADEINGYPIPAKATIVVSQMLAHRHPDFWHEPDRFDPTRFLPGGANDRPKFAYFPFGGGSRICIGNHMAMVEVPMILAALAQRFHFTLVPGQTVVPDPTFTLRPKDGVHVVVRKRR